MRVVAPISDGGWEQERWRRLAKRAFLAGLESRHTHCHRLFFCQQRCTPPFLPPNIRSTPLQAARDAASRISSFPNTTQPQRRRKWVAEGRCAHRSRAGVRRAVRACASLSRFRPLLLLRLLSGEGPDSILLQHVFSYPIAPYHRPRHLVAAR